MRSRLNIDTVPDLTQKGGCALAFFAHIFIRSTSTRLSVSCCVTHGNLARRHIHSESGSPRDVSSPAKRQKFDPPDEPGLGESTAGESGPMDDDEASENEEGVAGEGFVYV